MLVYLYVVIATFLILLIPIQSNRGYQIKLICSFIPLYLFGALRVDFGFDYSGYEEQFYDINSYYDWKKVNDHSEIGYLLLQRIIPSWRLLIAFQSLLVCIAYYILFYKYIPRKHIVLAFILLFLTGDKTIFFMFSAIRNSIAISLFLLSIPLIIEKRTVLYVCLSVLAMQFHTSAILVMPLMYIICYKNNFDRRSLLTACIIIFFIIITPVDRLVVLITPFMNDYFSRYDSYLETFSGMGDTRTVLVYFSSMFFLYCIFINIYRNKIDRTTLCLFLLAIITPLAPLLGTLNGRLSYYGTLFFILAVIKIFNSNNMKFRRGLLCFTFAYMGYAFFKVFMGNPLFPYKIYHSILE